MHWYADFKKDVGFRCHPCEIIGGPFYDDFIKKSFYSIRFIDCIPGTIAEEQMECNVTTNFIFDHAIELVDLPKECYWSVMGDEYEHEKQENEEI